MRLNPRRLVIAAGLVLAFGPLSVLAQPATGDMVLGNPRAAVTVTEYASMSCPHCAAWNEEVWPAFKAKYVDTGKVRYVFREFITEPAQIAAAGALLARCAGPAKFFGVVDGMFRAQEEIYRTRDLRGPLVAVAAKAGMNPEQMEACVFDEAALQALNTRVQGYIEKENIEVTPTFVINGKKLEGNQALTALDAAIAAAQAGR
jgi:protein-disulfide isomerase